LAQISVFLKIFICICSAEMDYMSSDSFLEVFLSSPWQQALISDSCYLLAIRVYCGARHKSQGQAESQLQFFLYICSLRRGKAQGAKTRT